MDVSLRMEKPDPDENELLSKGYWQKNLLLDEISGVMTSYIVVRRKLSVVPRKDRARIVLFVGGRGVAAVSDRVYPVNGIAILCPPFDTAFEVQADETVVKYLEILMTVTPAEYASRVDLNRQLPYFLNYSECDQYREQIKSVKTISRTLLPVDIIPRLAIGSVETTGPDTVQTHQHRMLEQLFFGLPGNNSRVTADDQEVEFKENVLLHIPQGSHHGVTVKQGNTLHYLWIDFFISAQDTSYIADTHISMNAE